MAEEFIPSSEPSEITIGEALNWRKSLNNFSPVEGHTLSYAFRGAGKGFNVTATADGSDFLVEVEESVTAEMTAGLYYWEAWVNDGTDDFMIESGQTLVRQNLKSLAVTTVVDKRSVVKKTLDAIDARIDGRITDDVQSYQIANRQLMKIPMLELLKLREHYASRYAKELRRARTRRGKPLIQSIGVRFDNP